MNHTDPDERWLGAIVHGAFFLLLGSSFARFLSRDQGGARTGWVVALFAFFCLLYVLGHLLAPPPRPGLPPTRRHLVWLGSVTAVWIVLLVLAPSATWCVMPLLFAGLHALPPRIAVPAAAVLTALVVLSEIRVADGPLNPNMVVAPPAVAAVATAVLVHLQRQGARQRVLIEDLVRTRHELAATERRAGVLAERQRLSAEIHDTLAQELSSQRMLLQAAERVWDTGQAAAREHVRAAAEITSRSLAEARRFVHDLAPADLAERSLAEALGELARRESGPGLTVEFRADGVQGPLPERVAAALLRIAQGALANVREHAAATRAALTLTWLDDQVSLDVADNGRGFERAGPPSSPVRLLLCDDHAVVRAGLRALLSSADGIDVVGEAATGEEALAMAAHLHPDVVLMDLQLDGGMDGVTATRQLTARGERGPRVLVLTMFDTDADITRAVEAGAIGYLLKAEQPEELFSAIRDAASGRGALSAPVADRLLTRLRSPRPALSAREHEILAQLARGLGNREIARALFISEATVKTHLGRIYGKLGVETRAGAVAVAKERRLLP